MFTINKNNYNIKYNNTILKKKNKKNNSLN